MEGTIYCIGSESLLTGMRRHTWGFPGMPDGRYTLKQLTRGRHAAMRPVRHHYFGNLLLLLLFSAQMNSSRELKTKD